MKQKKSDALVREPVSERQRIAEVFKKAIRNEFSFLKQTSDMRDLYVKGLRIDDGKGYLLPLCLLHTSDSELIKTLARWRDDNAFCYPTQFKVTVEGTSSWLKGRLLDVEDRILFLVVDPMGKPIGHMGFASCINDEMEMEADNIVRGEKDGNPGIMSAGMNTLLRWAHEQFGPSVISLRVMDDNKHAINFYRELGFVRDRLIPLRKTGKGDITTYSPLDAGDKHPPDKNFLRMIYSPPEVYDGKSMILTAGPAISAREASYAADAAYYGWNTQWSKYLTAFEKSFASYIGVKYAMATSSCTGALHIALAALGIGPGDEVIVPDLTWVATANAVLYVGATPVFADIQPDTWCMDPESVQKLINRKTRAIIPVHLYGHPADMDEILALARKHGLKVVEDAAPAIGAEYKGRKTGTFGDMAAFSFQGAKLLVTGEGGMLVCDDEKIFKQAYKLWDQGRVPGSFWIDSNGVKYKMSNIQAAIGLGQLERVEQMIEAKRRIFSWYEEGLSGTNGLRLNHEADWARSIYWMTSIELDNSLPLTRDALREQLKKLNVDTRSVFPSISQYPHWPARQPPQPVAESIGNRAMNLPSGICLTRDKVMYICKCIRELLDNA